MPLFPLLRQWLTGHSANDEGDASDPEWTRPDDWTDAGTDGDGDGSGDGGGDGGDY